MSDTLWQSVAASMFVEDNRHDSFTELWPHSRRRKCNPRNLAKAGFFYVGTEASPDAVECYLCSKRLEEWEPSDDPMKEHEKHMPRCPLFNFEHRDSRLQTFMKWPKHLFKATPENFADAGFVHVPTKESPDMLQCFSCQKCLGGWEATDDPFEEHKSRGQKCAFINAWLAEQTAASQAAPEASAASRAAATPKASTPDESTTPTAAKKAAAEEEEEAPTTAAAKKRGAGKRTARQTIVVDDSEATDEAAAAATTTKKKKAGKKVKVLADVSNSGENSSKEKPAAAVAAGAQPIVTATAAPEEEEEAAGTLTTEAAAAQNMTVAEFLNAKRDETVQRALRTHEARIDSFRTAAAAARSKLEDALKV